MEERLNRLDREMADMALRVRSMETYDTSYQRDVLKRIADVAADVKLMRSTDTDTKLANVAQDVQDIKEEMKATRFLIRSTLVTASSAIVLELIAFVVNKAAH